MGISAFQRVMPSAPRAVPAPGLMSCQPSGDFAVISNVNSVSPKYGYQSVLPAR